MNQALQGVATGVHAEVLSPQSGQDSGLSLVQEEGLPKSAYSAATGAILCMVYTCHV